MNQTTTGGASPAAGAPNGGALIVGGNTGSGAIAGADADGPGTGGAEEAGAPSQSGGTAGTGNTSTEVMGTPASVHKACDSLCDEFNRCPDQGGNFGFGCRESCWGAVYVAASAACTATGEVMVACLTWADVADRPACGDAFPSAAQKCAQEISAYQTCAKENAPGHRLPASFCSEYATGDATTSHCTDDLRCVNGDVYSIACNDNSDGQSDCACQANGAEPIISTVGGSTPDACLYHLCISP